MKTRTEKIAENAILTLIYRVSMPLLIAAVLFFMRQSYEDLRGGQKDQTTSINQVVINQAVAASERNEVNRRIAAIDDSIKSIWQVIRIGTGK